MIFVLILSTSSAQTSRFSITSFFLFSSTTPSNISRLLWLLTCFWKFQNIKYKKNCKVKRKALIICHRALTSILFADFFFNMSDGRKAGTTHSSLVDSLLSTHNWYKTNSFTFPETQHNSLFSIILISLSYYMQVCMWQACFIQLWSIKCTPECPVESKEIKKSQVWAWSSNVDRRKMEHLFVKTVCA